MKTTILGIIGLLLGQISWAQSLVPVAPQLTQAEQQLSQLWLEAELDDSPPAAARQAELQAWEAIWTQLAAAHTEQELAAFARELESTTPSELEAWIEAEGESAWQTAKSAHFSPSQ